MTNDMFETTNIQVKLLADLAMDSEIADPIDWSDLNVSEREAYIMMASHVCEMQNDPIVDKSIIVKLMVENFVLNLKLLGKK